MAEQRELKMAERARRRKEIEDAGEKPNDEDDEEYYDEDEYGEEDKDDEGSEDEEKIANDKKDQELGENYPEF